MAVRGSTRKCYIIARWSTKPTVTMKEPITFGLSNKQVVTYHCRIVLGFDSAHLFMNARSWFNSEVLYHCQVEPKASSRMEHSIVSSTTNPALISRTIQNPRPFSVLPPIPSTLICGGGFPHTYLHCCGHSSRNCSWNVLDF